MKNDIFYSTYGISHDFTGGVVPISWSITIPRNQILYLRYGAIVGGLINDPSLPGSLTELSCRYTLYDDTGTIYLGVNMWESSIVVNSGFPSLQPGYIAWSNYAPFVGRVGINTNHSQVGTVVVDTSFQPGVTGIQAIWVTLGWSYD